MNKYDLMSEYSKCIKEKCKDNYEKANNDKKIETIKKKIMKENDINKKEKLIRDLYSKLNEKKLELCATDNCSIEKKLEEINIKSLNNRIKIYNIKLPEKYQILFNNLHELYIKTSLTNKEKIRKKILFQILNTFVNDKTNKINDAFTTALFGYFNCTKNNCTELSTDVRNDKELMEKKVSLYNNIKNDKKRNNIIKEIYSNEKQVKLDKCLTNKCNATTLKLVQENLKLLKLKIKGLKLKISLPVVKKITEEDIPQLIIKLNQLNKLIEKYEY